MCTFGFSVRGLCGEIYSLLKCSLAVLRFSSAGISGERSTRFQDDRRAMQELPERRKSSVQVAVPAPELWRTGQPDSWPGPIPSDPEWRCSASDRPTPAQCGSL